MKKKELKKRKTKMNKKMFLKIKKETKNINNLFPFSEKEKYFKFLSKKYSDDEITISVNIFEFEYNLKTGKIK